MRTPRPSRRAPDVALPEELPPKLVPSLRALFSTAVALAHTRISLAGIELEEEIQRLLGAAVLALVSLILVLLALVVGTFTIVAAVPVESRVLTMVIITVVYAVIAAILVLRLKGIFTNRPPIFGATLAEFDKDKETLAQMAKAHEAAEEARDLAAKARARGEDAFAHETPDGRPTEPAGVL